MSNTEHFSDGFDIAVGGPRCGEQIVSRAARTWHCFDPDSLQDGPDGDGSRTVGTHTILDDDADLGRFLHRVITRHGYLLPAAVIRGCYHRAADGEGVVRYIDLGREGDSLAQQRYRRLGIFTMYHASHRLYPEQKLRRFNPELAIAVEEDWPHDAAVQRMIADYMIGYR